MIDANEPTSWQDLQDRVARILREAGVVTAVEKAIQTARGKVSIDVWAHDPDATPTQTHLIECSRWRNRVPQTVVHAFRCRWRFRCQLGRNHLCRGVPERCC